MQIKTITFLTFIFLICVQCTLKESNSNQISIALTQYPKTLDPRITTDATGQRLNQLIFQSLVKFDRQSKITPDAAKSWSYEPKTKTYTFTLENNLQFSENEFVTCEDILFSISEFQKPSSPFKSPFSVIENAECEMPSLKLKLKNYSATLLTDLTVLKILPKANVEKHQDNFGQNLVGSGPYFVKKLSFNEIILKRKSFAKTGNIDEFIFKIIQDDGTRFLNAYKGSIDIIPNGIPLNKISYLKERNKYQILTYPSPSMNYILVNFKDKDLQKLNLRKALAESIDVSEIIKFKLEGFGTQATSILPPANFFHANLNPIEYNIKNSKAFWKSSNIRTISLKTSNNPEVVEISKVLAEQFRKIGVELKVQSYEWGTFYGDLNKGQFQIAMMRWVGVTDPDIYRLAFHSREHPPGRNRGFYSNPKLDKLLDEGLMIEDMEKRKQHYSEIQKIVFEDLAIIPLWYNTQVDLVRHHILDYQPALNGDFTPFLDIRIDTKN